MAMIFIDGFDKYGPTGFTSAGLINSLLQEWTSQSGLVPTLVAGLSSTGQALSCTQFGGSLSRTLPASYTTFYCGWRYNVLLGTNSGVTFSLTSTAGLSVNVNSIGQLEVRSGSTGGTVKGTSSATVLSGSTHYIEVAATMSTSGAGACTVYLDGVAVITLASQTFATASINQVAFAQSGSSTFIVDDVYFFDSTGSTNNNVLLSSPRIETEFPSADSAVQFTPTAGVLGLPYNINNGSGTQPGANKLVLRKFTADVNATVNSISILPEGTSAGAKFKAVIYSDSGGAANTLLSAGPEVVGAVTNVALTLALTTPQALTAGTPYWIGFITDTAVNIAPTDFSNLGFSATNTYASGAPGTAPAMTGGFASWTIWGNLTGMAANFSQENKFPAPGVLGYNADSTVGHEDLFSVPALSSTPSVIYGVRVSGNVAKSDSGSRTISLRIKSGGSDGGGSNTGQAPGTTFGWLASIFETDPATGAAWTPTGLNASKCGYKVDS